MRHLRNSLRRCSLFTDLTDERLNHIINSLQYRTSEFSQGQTLAVEGSQCRHLGIILQGAVTVQKHYASGKVVTLARLQPGDVFAEALLFSERGQFPATLEAAEDDTQIMFLHQTEVVRLCETDRTFLQGFLRLLSDKILSLKSQDQDSVLQDTTAKNRWIPAG